LEAFLQPLNAQALASLHEAGEDLIALHCLNVPNTLHRNLLSCLSEDLSFNFLEFLSWLVAVAYNGR